MASIKPKTSKATAKATAGTTNKKAKAAPTEDNLLDVSPKAKASPEELKAARTAALAKAREEKKAEKEAIAAEAAAGVTPKLQEAIKTSVKKAHEVRGKATDTVFAAFTELGKALNAAKAKFKERDLYNFGKWIEESGITVVGTKADGTELRISANDITSSMWMAANPDDVKIAVQLFPDRSSVRQLHGGFFARLKDILREADIYDGGEKVGYGQIKDDLRAAVDGAMTENGIKGTVTDAAIEAAYARLPDTPPIDTEDKQFSLDGLVKNVTKAKSKKEADGAIAWERAREKFRGAWEKFTNSIPDLIDPKSPQDRALLLFMANGIVETSCQHLGIETPPVVEDSDETVTIASKVKKGKTGTVSVKKGKKTEVEDMLS